MDLLSKARVVGKDFYLMQYVNLTTGTKNEIWLELKYQNKIFESIKSKTE